MAVPYDDARASMHDVAAVRHRTRQARQVVWFPLVLFGVLVLAAAPFYRPIAGEALVAQGGGAGLLPGGAFTVSPRHLSLYWLIALPAGYLATAGYYRWLGRRRGVATSVVPYVITGLALLALLVIAMRLHRIGNNDVTIRGLLPLLVIAIGLVVLARVERSAALAVFAVAFLALAVLANLYNIENVAWRIGLGSYGQEFNDVVAGVALLIAGLGFGAWAGLRRR